MASDTFFGLQLGVIDHKYILCCITVPLTGVRACTGCNYMVSSGFFGFMVSLVSLVSWFHWFRGCHRFYGFVGVMVALVSLGFTVLLVSRVSSVSWFHCFRRCHGVMELGARSIDPIPE